MLTDDIDTLSDAELTARIGQLEQEQADLYQASIRAGQQADRLRAVRSRRMHARFEAVAAKAATRDRVWA